MSSDFYSKPSYVASGSFPVYSGKRKQTGGAIFMPIYSGGRRQLGGSIFGSIRNIIAPAGQAALKGLKTVASNKTVQNMAKTVAKEAAKKGTQVLANVAADALQGKSAEAAFKEHTTRAALDVLTNISSEEDEIRKKKLAKRRLGSSSKHVTSSKHVKSSKLKQNSKKRLPDPVEEIEPAISAKKRRAQVANQDLF